MKRRDGVGDGGTSCGAQLWEEGKNQKSFRWGCNVRRSICIYIYTYMVCAVYSDYAAVDLCIHMHLIK